MSQHRFQTEDREGRPIEVLMGWDRPLQGFFLVIQRPNDDIVYSNLVDGALDRWNGLPPTLDHFVDELRRRQIQVPQRMLNEIRLDGERNAGNREVLYRTSGFVERSAPAKGTGLEDRTSLVKPPISNIDGKER